MVRVIYLLSERDRDRRTHLIHQAVSGQRWRLASGKGHLRDADMVSIARKRSPPQPHVAVLVTLCASGGLA